MKFFQRFIQRINPEVSSCNFWGGGVNIRNFHQEFLRGFQRFLRGYSRRTPPEIFSRNSSGGFQQQFASKTPLEIFSRLVGWFEQALTAKAVMRLSIRSRDFFRDSSGDFSRNLSGFFIFTKNPAEISSRVPPEISSVQPWAFLHDFFFFRISPE